MILLLHVIVWLAALVPVIWLIGHRPGLNFEGDPQQENGERFRCREQRNKDRLLRIQLGFEVPTGWQFVLRPQTWLDRWGKASRLVAEPELGDARFDDAFYIEAEDPRIVHLFDARQDLRNLLGGLLLRLKARKAPFRRIDCIAGTLVLELDAFSATRPEQLVAEAVAWIQPLLQALREQVPERIDPQQQRRDPARLPRLLALASLCFGLVMAIWILMMGQSGLLDPWALFALSRSIALPALLLFMAWALYRVRRSPRRHRLALEWLLVATVGFVLSSFVLVRWLNGVLDVRTYETITVDSAWISARQVRKQGPVYSVYVGSKDPRLADFRGLDVSAATYNRLLAAWGSERIETPTPLLRLHPGALGFAWVDLAP